MAEIATVGCKVSAHDSCPETTIATGDEFFKIAGKAVAVVGSVCESHSCKDHGAHQDAITAGAPYFTVNGKAVARIGDAVDHGNAVSSGAGFMDVGNNGGTQCGLAIGYEAVSNCLMHYVQKEPLPASETDATILATPKIALNMAETDDDEDRRWGWKLLAPLLQKWISRDTYYSLADDIKSKPEKVEIYMLDDSDRDKTLAVKRVKKAFDALTGTKNSEENKNALDSLTNVIKKCSPEIWEKGGNFDYSTVEPYQYERHYFYYKKVNDFFKFDSVAVAFAAFTLRALPVGRVTVSQDGSRTVFLDEIHIYIDDRFNFSGEAYLGCWSRTKLDFAVLANADLYSELNNMAFRRFRSRHGKGGDFWILSQQIRSPEFVPFSYTAR